MGDKNLILVKSIEKFPCLYNHNSVDYAKKEVTDIAWNGVANETQLTVAECKEKWKNLRYGFIRSLRPNPDGSCKKKYYLHDDMEFVLPFMKLFPSRSSYMPLPNVDEVDTDEENNVEFITSTDNGQSPQFFEHENLLQSFEPPRKRARTDPKHVQYKTSFDRTNPRKMFLLSLLPEINELTEHQMKCFRRKVLALIDEIIDPSNECYTGIQNDVIIKSEYP